jgi:hypothetical protein
LPDVSIPVAWHRHDSGRKKLLCMGLFSIF